MTIGEILSNEELRGREYPVTRNQVFLAHAGDCPLPRRVTQAIKDYAERCTEGDQEAPVFPHLLDTTRERAAALLKCQADEVSLVGPTSLALSLVASGVRFRRNDNILIYFDDYPSNVYPWLALSELGVEVRLMNTRGLGLIRTKDVIGQVDENTRLVALASCHFISGFRIDLAAVGKYLRERKILFCVDGIQTLGALPTTVEHVDVLAADAHKWLLGPCGAGLLYVRRDIRDKINPRLYGWHNVQCPGYVAQEKISFENGPQKFEAGSQNFLGLSGLASSLELILELGIENIAAELLRKRAWIIPALQAKGCHVLMADAPTEHASAIISFQRPGASMAELHARLAEARIVTSLRTDRGGNQYIRLSPHYYNTDAELQRLIELI